MINVALIGYGTVNSGFREIFEEKRCEIEEAVDDQIKIKKIVVKHPEKHKDIEDLLVDRIGDIINDEEIDLVIEATGEVGPIEEDIKKLLEKKNLITSNKALVSRNFEKFEAIAKKYKRKFRFDAAVGGAVPTIENLYTIRTLNDVKKVSGIFNGSCNFVLSKMEEGIDFDTAVKEAQKLGFAELDPSNDIDGLDSMRKLRLAASILFNKSIKEENIDLEGIRKITNEDIEEAKANKQRYKLIAYGDDEGAYRVRPELVDIDSNFGKIKDNENIFQIETSNAKILTFIGPGAGKRETGFAILNDFLNIYGIR